MPWPIRFMRMPTTPCSFNFASSASLAVARTIGEHINDYRIVIDKSTVPVGTADKVRAELANVATAAADALAQHIGAWTAQVRRHARLPGDHKGNTFLRHIWKGAGLGDDAFDTSLGNVQDRHG